MSALAAAVRSLPGVPVRPWRGLWSDQIAILEERTVIWCGPAALLPADAYRFLGRDIVLTLHPDALAALDAEMVAGLTHTHGAG